MGMRRSSAGLLVHPLSLPQKATIMNVDVYLNMHVQVTTVLEITAMQMQGNVQNVLTV